MPTATPKRRKPSSKTSRTDPKQSERFIKAAQELGLGDKAGKTFEQAMDVLTKPKKKAAN
jgi:hypothetical protein